MDSQRALLDELMGVNRNLDNEEGIVDHFEDERACKAYMCGLCPHDLFSNTKQDLGACDYLHDEDLKKQYEEKVAEGMDYGYDKELESILVRHIQDVDKKIARSQRRLEEGGQGAMAMDTAALRKNEEIIAIEAQVSDIMKNAEAKGEEGDVDEAQELFQQAEELQQKKATLEAKALQASIAEARAQSAPLQLTTTNPTAQELGNSTQQKLRVCDICGALLSIFDSNDRLAEQHGRPRTHVAAGAAVEERATKRTENAESAIEAAGMTRRRRKGTLAAVAPGTETGTGTGRETGRGNAPGTGGTGVETDPTIAPRVALETETVPGIVPESVREIVATGKTAASGAEMHVTVLSGRGGGRTRGRSKKAAWAAWLFAACFHHVRAMKPAGVAAAAAEAPLG
eukprot:jgi/Undpi1/13220/HiC_scaffold_8.g02882.m1